MKRLLFVIIVYYVAEIESSLLFTGYYDKYHHILSGRIGKTSDYREV